jgi:arylsulfatase A-like enzyme
MKKRSLILVTVDCLRADHVGFLGYSRPVTPFLDSLAGDSVVCSGAIVAGAPTYFSFPAIMASRHPLALGRDVLGIAPGEATLASSLRDAGYSTAAFVAGNPYLSLRFGYGQGFDTFHDCLDANPAGDAVMRRPARGLLSGLNRRTEAWARRTALTAAAYDELYFWYCQSRTSRQNLSMDQLRCYPSADVVVDRALSWFADLGDRPFFLWLHLMDPHHPYYPPMDALRGIGVHDINPRRARFLNSFWNRFDIGPDRLQRYRKEIISLYDAGIYWVDRQISRLVRALEEFRRWDETVLALTADHGEEFLEHGERYHAPVSLYEQLIRVPLLVRAPGVSGRRVSNTPVSLLHLTPTLLNAMDVAAPSSFRGRSLWGEGTVEDRPAEPAVVECIDACNNPFRAEDRMRPRLLAIRDRRFKLVINFRENEDTLYDLEADHGELSPLAREVHAKERARLLTVALEHLKTTRRGQDSNLRLRARLVDLRQSLGTRDGILPSSGREETQQAPAQ